MRNSKSQWGLGITEAAFSVILFIISCMGILNINALHANPVILIPFIVSLCMFTQELTGALTGLMLGIFTDSVSSTGSMFHTLFFFLLGFLISLFSHYLLNNNYRAAITVSLIATSIYFILRWLFFHAFTENINDSAQYLTQYAFPSLIYTNIFILPFYFIQKHLHNSSEK